MARIHILGASGSGTSTLGSALARRLGVPHVDSDSFFWLPTDPPYTTPRPVEERQALLTRRLPVTAHWVFSGAATRWAAPLEPHYDLVVFLRLDPAIRMDRLRRREAARWGARILPGGDMAVLNAAFITLGRSLRHRRLAASGPSDARDLAGGPNSAGAATGFPRARERPCRRRGGSAGQHQ